jgi:hypothetical protein
LFVRFRLSVLDSWLHIAPRVKIIGEIARLNAVSNLYFSSFIKSETRQRSI